MRRALRLFAAVVIGCSLVATVADVAVIGYSVSRNPHVLWWNGLGPSVYSSLPLLLLGLVACAAGVLLCLTELTLPLPTPRPARGRAVRLLGLLAAAQVCGGIAAGLFPYGVLVWALWSDRRIRVETEDVVLSLLTTFAGLGLSCVGGLLWCAIRVAYAQPSPLPKQHLHVADAQPRVGPVGEQGGDQPAEPARE